MRCHPVSVNFTAVLDYFGARPDTGLLGIGANPQYLDEVSVTCYSGSILNPASLTHNPKP